MSNTTTGLLDTRKIKQRAVNIDSLDFPILQFFNDIERYYPDTAMNAAYADLEKLIRFAEKHTGKNQMTMFGELKTNDKKRRKN